jgi:peptide/nickel transport system ATP-binding protein
MTEDALLSVKNLTVVIDTADGGRYPVQDMSFELRAGETLGIVGETGSGKTMLVRSVMGLLPARARYHAGSKISFDGLEITEASGATRRSLWGRSISLIPQNPASSLNPVRRIGAHLTDGLRAHGSLSRTQARARAEELLGQVGIADPARRMDMYPHEMSGGMKQRVLIAAAIAMKPDLLIADEPTTALDVTIQRQILDLLRELSETHGMAVLMVTHDLGVIANETDRVLVMYGGRKMEALEAAGLIERACHPYTAGLIRSRPDLSFPAHMDLETIPGEPVALGGLHSSCPFAARCERRIAPCSEAPPEARAISSDSQHELACFNPQPDISAEQSEVMGSGGTAARVEAEAV